MQIKNEPMLFGADYGFAYTNGGNITRNFLNAFYEDNGHLLNKKLIIDSRVHMLMPGWYPCIPGWHHDDVARTRKDGQPNYTKMPYKSKHCAAIIGDASVTEFMFGSISLDIPKLGKTIYKEWNNEINHRIWWQKNKIKSPPKNKFMVQSIEIQSIATNKLVYFDWQTFHRGMPATKNGWRMFIRASWDTDRPIMNEIRKQTQVYMSALEAGW
jgi:hypothetical protein